MVLIFGFVLAARFGPVGIKILFWILIGLACSAFFKYGIAA